MVFPLIVNILKPDVTAFFAKSLIAYEIYLCSQTIVQGIYDVKYFK